MITKFILKDYEGVFPSSYEDLIRLKGIGDYTASAICAIAYNQYEVAVDVNVKRVVSRINNKHSLSNIEIKKLTKNINIELSPSLTMAGSHTPRASKNLLPRGIRSCRILLEN